MQERGLEIRALPDNLINIPKMYVWLHSTIVQSFISFAQILLEKLHFKFFLQLLAQLMTS
jgi:hypothetical protein